jgi:hypothetical protein
LSRTAQAARCYIMSRWAPFQKSCRAAPVPDGDRRSLDGS